MKKKIFLSFALSMFLINAFAFSLASVETMDVAHRSVFDRGIINQKKEVTPALLGEDDFDVITVTTTVDTGRRDKNGDKIYDDKSKTITRPTTVPVGSVEWVTPGEVQSIINSLGGDPHMSASEYAAEANSKMQEEYKEVTVNAISTTYYMQEDWLDIVESLSGRRLFVPVGSGLKYVNFDEREVDLFQTQEIINDDLLGYNVDENRSAKYRAAAVYSSGLRADQNDIYNNSDPNHPDNFITKPVESARYFGPETYLLEVKESSCKECFNKNIAVPDLVTAPTNDKMFALDYCEDHACAFAWRVKVGSNAYNFETVEDYLNKGFYGIHEGVLCTEKNNGSSNYCDKHICQYSENCSRPVIGSNLVDVKYPYPIPYQGADEAGYSTCCEYHFCIHFGCNEKRINEGNAPKRTADGDKKIVTAFSEYCEKHGNDCALMTATGANLTEGVEMTCKVYEDAYTAVLKPICMEGIVANFKFKNDEGKYEVLVDEFDNFMLIDEIENKRCTECGNYIMDIRSISGLCYNCAELKELTVSFDPLAKVEAVNVGEKKEATSYESEITRVEYKTKILESIAIIKDGIWKMLDMVRECSNCKKSTIWTEMNGIDLCSSCGKDAYGFTH